MRTKLGDFCDKVLEAGWLLALVLAPLYFNVYSSRVFEPDKLSLVRSIALIMAATWLVKVLDTSTWGHSHSANSGTDDGTTPPGLKERLTATPLVLPTLLLVAAYLLSTALSVAPRISLWGSYVRLQGTYTTLSYITIFLLMLGTIRRQEQVDRITATIILTSLPISLYGILQHYGLDSLPWSGDVVERVAANMGNSIFVASYLIMAVPITLTRLVESFSRLLREQDSSISQALLAGCYTFVLCVQLICIVFTQSRGPLLGLLGGLYVFVLVGLISLRRGMSDQRPVNAQDALRAAAFALISIPVGVFPAYVALVALKRGLRWLWLSWVFLTLIVGTFLVVFNLPNTPLSALRQAPYIGRLGQVFEMDTGTGKVRVLIWEGALELIQSDPLRALVGYGPETMHVAYNPYYPPDLAHYEARNASPDRSHNETFDALVITGVAGFAAYMFLFTSVFYFGLKWLGFMESQRQRNLFLGLGALGAILGILLPRLLEGSFKLSGVGLPVGLIVGTSVYLMLAAAFFYRKEQPALSMEQQLLLIGLLAAIVAHFIEIHFGIAIAATRTHFWAFAALFSMLGLNLVTEREAAEQPDATATAREERRQRGSRRSRRRDRRQAQVTREAPPPETATDMAWKRRLLAGSLVVAVILTTLGFEFVANPMREFDALRIIRLSLTTLAARSDPRTSYGTLWLFFLTWLVGALVVLADSEKSTGRRQASGWWLSSLGLYSAITLGILLVSLIVHTSGIKPQADIARTVNSFYALTLSLGLLLALALFGNRPRPSTWFRKANLWAYPIPIMLAALIVFATNISPVKADIYYKTGLKLEDEANGYLSSAQTLASQGLSDEAAPLYESAVARLDRSIEFYQRALNLTPDQDYYYLFVGRAMMGKASALSDPQQKELWFEQSYGSLERARALNPLNTDHYANLGRLFRSWSGLAATPEERTQKLQQSQAYYEQATGLSPNNAQLFNEWALLRADLGDYEGAFEKIDRSLSLDEQYAASYIIAARLHYQQGEEEEAIRALEQATLRQPRNIEAHSWLGFLYAQQGEMEQAADENLAVLSSAPDDLISHRNLVVIYQQLEQQEKANLHWQAYQSLEALKANADDGVSHRALATTYQQLGLFDAAIRHAQRAVELSSPSEWPALQSLIEQLRAQKEAAAS